jgi:hypothetical protein
MALEYGFNEIAVTAILLCHESINKDLMCQLIEKT